MAFGPAMYVGESNCIRTRTIQHISDGSDLRLRIADLTLEIEDLALYYAETPNITLDTRRLLESVLTHILGAPLTYRAG